MAKKAKQPPQPNVQCLNCRVKYHHANFPPINSPLPIPGCTTCGGLLKRLGVPAPRNPDGTALPGRPECGCVTTPICNRYF